MDTSYFHILAIVKITTSDMGVQHSLFKTLISFVCVCVCVCVWVYIYVCVWSRIAGSYGGSIFSFLRIFHMFSIVAAPVYIPTRSAQVFPFLHVLTNICFLLSFWP